MDQVLILRFLSKVANSQKVSTLRAYLKKEHVIYRKRKRSPKQSEDQKKRAKSLNF